MQAICSEVVSYLSHLATKYSGKSINHEFLLKAISELNIPGMKEEADVIVQYLLSTPATEKKDFDKQQSEEHDVVDVSDSQEEAASQPN